MDGEAERLGDRSTFQCTLRRERHLMDNLGLQDEIEEDEIDQSLQNAQAPSTPARGQDVSRRSGLL